MARLTEVYLLNVPLEDDYKHTLYFTSKENQQSYFLSKKLHSFPDLSYQRKDSSIRIPLCYDDVVGCNYVMYRNTLYTNKWYYAFITDIEYENDEVTKVKIETDVIQTWLFEYKLKPSFVEREHVSNDTIGVNTYPEGLETGEYICNEKFEDNNGKELYIYMAYSDYSENVQGDVKGKIYGGVYSGMGYSCFNTTTDGVNSLNEIISSYDSDSKADAINSIFMGPKWLTGINEEGFIAATLGPSVAPRYYTIDNITKPSSINGYVPRNKKLLTYPYNYLCVSNNAGSSVVYKYELFSGSICNFQVGGVITPSCSIRLNPLHYKGCHTNQDEGINGGKYPICCWNSDTYTNWLTQNGVNIALNLATGVGQIAVGAGLASATGGIGLAVGGGSIAGGVHTITSTLASMYEHHLVPDQVQGNINCGDVVTGGRDNCFMFYKMSIRQEYARIIDEYFDMFGYKVCRVKQPNKAHRSRYWYTKTIDVNIDGAIPTSDMKKIKDCYNNGITFWRNADEIQNYSLSNKVV